MKLDKINIIPNTWRVIIPAGYFGVVAIFAFRAAVAFDEWIWTGLTTGFVLVGGGVDILMI